ncbi:hypothetical protein K503DRAFT_167492 [Rhizopogon vinicolor AM-OR11-026]|uniref:Uncharacterized protein n=1 Tax=Rhizopogon vinicolor AM-OR11-026 TaxID=1314800 RepID=A0A1B7NF18_9AGAM|nr:hypothetical protein K503DRAFT_167492 [Rhizopogon vinicolor AM-OR11-026]
MPLHINWLCDFLFPTTYIPRTQIQLRCTLPWFPYLHLGPETIIWKGGPYTSFLVVYRALHRICMPMAPRSCHPSRLILSAHQMNTKSVVCHGGTPSGVVSSAGNCSEEIYHSFTLVRQAPSWNLQGVCGTAMSHSLSRSIYIINTESQRLMKHIPPWCSMVCARALSHCRPTTAKGRPPRV